MTRTTLLKTRVGIDRVLRTHMVALLNQQLSDSIDLYTQIKQAHWNVTGPQFFQVHLLFDKLAETVEEQIDLIAERATTLGGVALGTARMVVAASRLADYPAGAYDVLASLDALAARFKTVGDSTRAAIGTAADAGDPVTADLFTQVSRDLDSSLWLLEAHLRS